MNNLRSGYNKLMCNVISHIKEILNKQEERTIDFEEELFFVIDDEEYYINGIEINEFESIKLIYCDSLGGGDSISIQRLDNVDDLMLIYNTMINSI